VIVKTVLLTSDLIALKTLLLSTIVILLYCLKTLRVMVAQFGQKISKFVKEQLNQISPTIEVSKLIGLSNEAFNCHGDNFRRIVSLLKDCSFGMLHAELHLIGYQN